jgi:hypothetical protein
VRLADRARFGTAVTECERNTYFQGRTYYARLNGVQEVVSSDLAGQNRWESTFYVDGRLVGYFCPVLTADGKLDCAPK